jgi:hypothetical protein
MSAYIRAHLQEAGWWISPRSIPMLSLTRHEGLSRSSLQTSRLRILHLRWGHRSVHEGDEISCPGLEGNHLIPFLNLTGLFQGPVTCYPGVDKTLVIYIYNRTVILSMRKISLW